MERITKQQIQEYVSEMGDFEKNHRKGSSFYATAYYTFKQADVDELTEDGINASELLDVTVTLSGYWNEYNGCEWEDISFSKYEKYQELIPEVVIPAHYETKYREVEFTATFE